MNTIVKSIAALTLVLLMVPTTFGQEGKRTGGKEKKEKIQELKVNFINTELSLTPEESEKFWPMYNEMEAKIKTERKSQRTIEKDLRENHATLTDAEKKTKVLALFDSEQKETAIKREYYTKIGDKIGYAKSTKLLSLEKKFKRELMKQLQEKKQAGSQGQPAQEKK